jgi:hypothetical protein
MPLFFSMKIIINFKRKNLFPECQSVCALAWRSVACGIIEIPSDYHSQLQYCQKVG